MSSDAAKRKERPGLLKFCSPTDYALSNLENCVIYCQHYEGFNDPFEFWTNLVDGIPDLQTEPERFLAAARAWGFDNVDHEAVQMNSKDYFDSLEELQPPFKEMLDGMRIACFGAETDNLLMWSHYADGLRGFCVVFDEDLIVAAEPKGYITNVTYLEQPPLVDSFVYAVAYDQEDYHVMAIQETERNIQCLGKTDEAQYVAPYQQASDEAHVHMHDMWQQVFAAKPLEWRYEQERRLLVQIDGENKLPILRPYSHKAVKEIIIGERMSPSFKERLTGIVRETYGDIPIRSAARATESYTLIIE